MRRIVPALLCLTVAVPAIVVAAAPRKGGHYTGRSTPLLGSKRHTVSIRVSDDGRTGTFRYCGDRRRRAMSARFNVRRRGRFTAIRRERRRGGKRVVTFQATGRFTTRTRVRGNIAVVFECDHTPGTYTARLRR